MSDETEVGRLRAELAEARSAVAFLADDGDVNDLIRPVVAERDALKAEVGRLVISRDEAGACILSMGAELEALKATVERMRADLAALVGVDPHTDWGDILDQVNEIRREWDALKAAIERARRVAQVWIDIRPTYPTATREGHAMAYAGQQILAALAVPESTEG